MQLFTIGHSTHPQTKFLELLIHHRITALCDVRSTPYSRSNPQFNRDCLKAYLRLHLIEYVFLGKELGARSNDPFCYEHGKVQYDRLAQTDLFRHGLERVEKGAQKYRVALMCAEKEPLECHRTILVARHLVERGVTVHHIHEDGELEAHPDALRRLAQMFNLRCDEHDMFCSPNEMWNQAYRLQENRIAYALPPERSANPSNIKRATG